MSQSDHDNKQTTMLERWIEALKSGDYPVGYYALRSLDADGNRCYCALGVLADLHVQAQPDLYSWDAVAKREGDSDILCVAGHPCETATVPQTMLPLMVSAANVAHLNDEYDTDKVVAYLQATLEDSHYGY